MLRRQMDPGRSQRRNTMIRKLMAIATLVCFIIGSADHAESAAEASGPQERLGYELPLNKQAIDNHRQLYAMSCIPMSIELVLKLLGRVPSHFYALQESWKNKSDGNFSDFDGKTINGIRFRKQFAMPRNRQFPLAKLFETIDRELKTGRYVIVSLPSSATTWHMYVIYGEGVYGDFVAVSKSGNNTIEAGHLKGTITKLEGTDILTYELPA
jgi:hypothetical protein